MKDFCKLLLGQLDRQLDGIVPLLEEDPLSHCELALGHCMAAHAELKAAFLRKRHARAEEIEFFKNGKPRLAGRIIYFSEVYRIECNRPVASGKAIRKYYARRLKKLERFFSDNAEFYRYCRKGDQYLDDVYFIRERQEGGWPMDGLYFQMDRSFATSHDYKAAQLLAYERLQGYLAGKAGKPKASGGTGQEKVLRWTAPKVGMVELIYALHTEGAFNHGAADLGEIVQVFGRVFGMDLGQFHRTFHEICNRKYERTKFLLSLQEKLARRMDQADER